MPDEKLRADVLADGTDEEVVTEIWRWSRHGDSDKSTVASLWFLVGVLMGRLSRKRKADERKSDGRD